MPAARAGGVAISVETHDTIRQESSRTREVQKRGRQDMTILIGMPGRRSNRLLHHGEAAHPALPRLLQAHIEHTVTQRSIAREVDDLAAYRPVQALAHPAAASDVVDL